MFHKDALLGGDEVIWLIELRKMVGMTQQNVADAADIKRASYCNIESGTRRPSVEVAKRIANVLGFDWTLFYEKPVAS